jgi:transcriptional repressor NrdR
MNCIFCGADTKVTDKRESNDATRRRRECLKCHRRFTTYEKAEKDIVVVKKDGRRESFSKDKLKAGIMRACEKRPISIEKINEMIEDIEEKLLSKKEVKTNKIGEMVMNKLKKLDKIAYIRFSSVYRDFQDINDFKKAIKQV